MSARSRLTADEQHELVDLAMELGAAKLAAGMACGTGASPDWERADAAYMAILDWAYAEVAEAVAS